MADRLHSLTVVLEKDTSDEDAQQIIDAIRMIREVVSVTGNVADVTSHIAETRAKKELLQELWNIFQ